MLFEERQLKPYFFEDSTYPILQESIKSYNVQRSYRRNKDDFDECV